MTERAEKAELERNVIEKRKKKKEQSCLRKVPDEK